MSSGHRHHRHATASSAGDTDDALWNAAASDPSEANGVANASPDDAASAPPFDGSGTPADVPNAAAGTNAVADTVQIKSEATTISAADPTPLTSSQTGLSLTYKGFNYVGDVYGSYQDANSLSGVVAAGANSVAVTADYGIDAVNSAVYADSVAGGYTESTSNVQSAITDATGLGLSVMYRPLIDFLPSNYETDPGGTNAANGTYSAGEFRSYYNPSNVASFFASYKTMILAQAAAAEASGATLFCVGTELDQLTGAAYESYWTNAGGTGIIDEIRAADPNLKLTYAADWDDALSPWQYGGSGLSVGTGDITTQVSFWDKLDYVGIDEYAPISDLANPTVAQLVNGWTETPTDATTLAVTGEQSLISYYQGISAALGKPLIFTELGYANSSDADFSPATPGFDENGNADGATADPTMQANLYQAFFQAWQQDGNGSLAGTYLWNWEPAGAGVSPFSVQGLAAQTQVSDGFAAACYAAGTNIATPHGPVPIERLREGDLVCLASGGARPVRWIGFRAIDLTRHAAPGRVRPIRIAAHAFAPGIPSHDLRLSPDHAVLLDGVLIPAKLLVNHTSITRETSCRAVTYYHVELDTHEVLLAEGLAAESYLDTGNRGMFENAGEALTLHPVFDNDQARREAASCAPFAADARRVEPIWRALAARATAMGLLPPIAAAFTSDPALCLTAGGRTIKPLSRVGNRYEFVLNCSPRPRLVSRAAIPHEHRPWVDEHRQLGVSISRLTLRTGNVLETIPLDHPMLRDGWWDIERDGGRMSRWTTGDAALPLNGRGPRVLEIELAESLAYPIERDGTPPARIAAAA